MLKAGGWGVGPGLLRLRSGVELLFFTGEHRWFELTFSDSDKSIRSDFSSVTLSEDRLTTSSPPFSSLNTISSSELHASSPAAPPSSLAWGITSAGRAAVTATLVSGGGCSLWIRTPNTRVTAVHPRLSAVVILYKYYDYRAWRQPYRRRIVITAGSAHLSRRPAYGGRRRRNTTFVREPITHHHTIRHCDDAKRYPKFRRRHDRTENANERRTITTTTITRLRKLAL